MKKLLFGMFLFLFSISFGLEEKTVSNIETFKFEAREVTILNNKKRIIEYSVLAKLPDLIKKEILFPKENLGEVYIYDKNKKIVYLPLFDQSYEEKLDVEENYVIKVMKDLKERELSDPNFKDDFYSGKIKEVSYENGLRIQFEKLEKIDGYYFPVSIKVYDGESLISEVIMKNIQINITLSDEDFKI